MLERKVTKQPRLYFVEKISTKVKIDRLVAAYVVEEMLPVSSVVLLSFRDILSNIYITEGGHPTSDRKTFPTSLECSAKMEADLKKRKLKS